MSKPIDWGEILDSDDEPDEPFSGIPNSEKLAISLAFTLGTSAVASSAFFRNVEGLKAVIAAIIPLYNIQLKAPFADTKYREELKKQVQGSFDAMVNESLVITYDMVKEQLKEQGISKKLEQIGVETPDDSEFTGTFQRRKEIVDNMLGKVAEAITQGIDKGNIDATEIAAIINESLALFEKEHLAFFALSGILESADTPGIMRDLGAYTNLDKAMTPYIQKGKLAGDVPKAFKRTRLSENNRAATSKIVMAATHDRPEEYENKEPHMVTHTDMFPAHTHTLAGVNIDDTEIEKFLGEWSDNEDG